MRLITYGASQLMTLFGDSGYHKLTFTGFRSCGGTARKPRRR